MKNYPSKLRNQNRNRGGENVMFLYSYIFRMNLTN